MRVIEKLQIEDLNLINYLINSDNFSTEIVVSKTTITTNFKELNKDSLTIFNTNGHDYEIKGSEISFKRKACSKDTIQYEISELGISPQEIDVDKINE